MPWLDFLLHPFVLIPLAIWSVAIKGIALWRAARRKEKGWFVVLLILNTLGILELIYLFLARKQSKPQPKKKQKTAFDALADPDMSLSSRRQAILHVLMGILDDEHQTTLSNVALERAISTIEERVTDKINQQKLQSMLDKPEAKGGAGLYKQTAERIASHIEAMLKATK